MHTYASSGVYQVKLAVTGLCGTREFSIPVTIENQNPPTITASSNVSTVCQNAAFEVTANAVNATDVQWYLGAITGSPVATGVGPLSLTSATAGPLTVYAVAVSAFGLDTATINLNVTGLPGATVSYVVQQNFVQFGATPTAPVSSWLWAFGDGNTSTLQNPMHTYAQNGTYATTLTVTNSCGSATYTQDVVLATPPSITINNGATTACQNAVVQFSATATSTNEIQWYLGSISGNPLALGAGPVELVAQNSGAMTVYAVAVGSFGLDTATYTVQVAPLPAATVTSGVVQNMVQFSSAPSTPVTGYAWAFGDGATGMGQNVQHLYQQNGTYQVTLTLTNACGTSTVNETVVVNVQLPSAGILVQGGLDTVCVGTQLSITGLVPPDVMINDWSWNFGAGATPSSAQGMGGHQVTFSTPGLKIISVTVTNIAGSQTIDKQVFVQAAPVPVFTVTENLLTVTLQNQTSNATSYLWNFGDGNTSTSPNPTHTYASEGIYLITLTATNSCGPFTSTDTVTVKSVGVDDLAKQVQLSVYPNPATDLVTLNLTGLASATDAQIMVYATDGRLVLQQRAALPSGNSQTPIQLQAMPSGKYAIVVRSSLGQWFGEVIVE